MSMFYLTLPCHTEGDFVVGMSVMRSKQAKYDCCCPAGNWVVLNIHVHPKHQTSKKAFV